MEAIFSSETPDFLRNTRNLKQETRSSNLKREHEIQNMCVKKQFVGHGKETEWFLN
jgi:hypothetical protein